MHLVVYLVAGWAAFGTAAWAQPVAIQRAEERLARLRELQGVGAVARAQVVEAEQALEDARDDEVLRQTLYGIISIEDLTETQSVDMLEAARRRIARTEAKIGDLRKLVEMGVVARNQLVTHEEELARRQKTLELAEARARTLAEIAAMIHREEELEEEVAVAAVPQGPVPPYERFEGAGVFRPQHARLIESAFEQEFSHPLPVSARGMTALHRTMGFDHRDRVDVAVSPDDPEGVWLRRYLERLNIPYYAFRTRIRGKATGAHIHIGPPSNRLRGVGAGSQ